MELILSSPRDISGLVVARLGSVQPTSDRVLPWAVVDGAGAALRPANDYLRHLLACGSSPLSCRSYGHDLLRWFRFLSAVDVVWSRAQRSDVRDFVLWLRTCENPARRRRRPDAPAPGSVNPKTGKANLSAGYAPATINHAVSVLAEFYEFHLGTGEGPLVSPVPPQRRRSGRINAHHNPMEPFAVHRRGPYRQKQPEQQPRTVPDGVLTELFADLDCHRDRAMFTMFLSSGARASELLSMTVGDVHPGDGRIFLQGKGMGGVKQECPASPEAFAWLALYLGELAQNGHRPEHGEPLWWTRRRPYRPLTYTALRAVLRRINERLGTNITVHDLRHTLCLRLVSDPNLTLVDAQQVMRHRHITTTSKYLRPRMEEVIARVQEHYNRPTTAAPPSSTWQYDTDDLSEIFGSN